MIDGFDKYGKPGQLLPDVLTLLIQGAWTAGGNNLSIVDPLTAQGGNAGNSAFAPSGVASWISKTLPGNYSRLVGGVRICPTHIGTDQTNILQFDDLATPQCSIVININGTFSLFSGVFDGGTSLGTSTLSISQSSIHYLEWDITFGTSAAFTLYLDGNSILTGTGNTRGGTSNSYCNVLVLGNTASRGQSAIMDDLYLFDTTGSFNNAVLNTNPVIITQIPTADTQTQFTNVANMLGTNYSLTTTDGNLGPGLLLRKYTAAVDSTIQSISLLPDLTASTAKFKPVIYTDTANAPTTLLSAGSEVIGASAGDIVTLPLTTPQSLVASTSYWIGFVTDSNLHFRLTDTATSLGYSASNTYSNPIPDPAPTMTDNQPSLILWGNCTGATTDFESVAVVPPPGDASSISSSTVNDEDLYSFPSVSLTTIYTMAVKGHLRKSDTGSRTISLRVLSSSTDDGGSSTGQAPGTTYEWHDSYFDVDPNTSTSWSTAGVNAATSGIKIDS